MILRRLIIALTFLAIFAMAARISMDSDTWWQLRTGQWIADNRAVPKSDSFSYTREGQSWRYPSAAWLSELGLFLLYERLGAGALNLWVAAVVAGAFAFIYLTLSGGPFLRAFTLILAAAASGVYWAARPHIASFFFTAFFLWVLESHQWKRKPRLYLLPIAMLLWVNSHPGFAIGFLLWGIYLLAGTLNGLNANWRPGRGPDWAGLRAGWREDQGGLALNGALMFLAASANPSGPALLAYPFETLSIGILRNFIQEWQSPNFHAREMLPFLVLLLFSLIVLGASTRRLSLSDGLLLAVFTPMAFLAGRNVALFALVAAPILSRHAQPMLSELARKWKLRLNTRRPPNRAQALLNWGLLTFALAAVFLKAASVYPLEVNAEAFGSQVPVGAVEFLKREQPPGRLFNSYNWGGYLLWALPEYPVFVDGRTDLYADEVLAEWLSIVSAEAGWQARLDAWDVRLVLLEPHWPLVQALESEGWQQIYKDQVAVLFSR